VRREGKDLTMVSAGVSVHRCLQAADQLQKQGFYCTIIDLRTISPLDTGTICQSVAETGRLLVVDEDYQGFGLSGELAAIVLEAGIRVHFARVCTQTTIPYARKLEDRVLPNTERIRQAAIRLLEQTEVVT
jgi:pyruvate dehydrogenase E1 component beta subunit